MGIDSITEVNKNIDEIEHVEKFNPFHDSLGRFSTANGMSSYSANPKTKAGQLAIGRSAPNHGHVLNIHSESKGENIRQNAQWIATGQKPTVTAAQQQTLTQRRQQRMAQRMAQQQAAASSTQNTPPKPQKTSLKVSDGHAKNSVDGKDLSGSSFKFKTGTTDMPIEQVLKAQGMDGLPTVTHDRAEFRSAASASNFIAKRGVGASDNATMQAYDNELKNGTFYVKCSGGSVHGYGMYCASLPANASSAKNGLSDATSTGKAYARSGGPVQKVYTMTLDKSAKIGTEDDINRQMSQDTAFQKLVKGTPNANDVGVYAAYKGYDAFIADGGRWRNDGYFSDYTVILNRSKVIIYEP